MVTRRIAPRLSAVPRTLPSSRRVSEPPVAGLAGLFARVCARAGPALRRRRTSQRRSGSLRAQERPERRPPALSDEALQLLLGYAWPGEVREMRNVLERALIFSAGAERVRAPHLGIARTTLIKKIGKYGLEL